jgi:hypothetical protein
MVKEVIVSEGEYDERTLKVMGRHGEGKEK